MNDRLSSRRAAPWLLAATLLVSCAKTPLPDAAPEAGAANTAAPQPKPAAPPPEVAKGATPPTGDASVFPLVRGSRYTFEGEFRGQTSATELELRVVEVGGEQVFYFADLESQSDLIAPAFGLGAFVARGDGLYTADVLSAGNLPKLSRTDLKPMMALPPVVGATLAVSTPAQSFVPGREDTYRVDGVESVTVPAGTFPGCVRLVTDSVIDGDRESATVWLAPGVGPVKLLRGTGRVDQLTKFARGG